MCFEAEQSDRVNLICPSRKYFLVLQVHLHISRAVEAIDVTWRTQHLSLVYARVVSKCVVILNVLYRKFLMRGSKVGVESWPRHHFV